jgi:membrane fusion protein (multidrug efflux system)
VTVSADMPGIVESIAFDSGQWVREGSVLVTLDTKQETAQLAAAEAERDLARLQLERVRGLRSKGVTSQAELDAVSANAKTAEARVGEIEAAIERKTIRAPFSGQLGIRAVNVGQYLEGGSPVAPLQSLHPIHVDFSVPQQQVARLVTGAEVRVRTDGGSGDVRVGRISAIDTVVDEATRNVRVRATLPNSDGRLRSGMFVETEVPLGSGPRVVVLPASSISYAPYGDSVFVVEDIAGPNGESYLGVRQQFVKLGGARGDQVAIVSGVTAGEEIVTSGVFKLRNGAAVQVDNDVQPSNEPAPAPEES